MNDLQELLSTQDEQDPALVLRAIREGLSNNPSDSGPAAELHHMLLGFFDIEDVAVNSSHQNAFEQHPEAARRLLAMLEADGENSVADLMRSLMDGTPRPTGALEAGLRGPATELAAKHGKKMLEVLDAFAKVALENDASAAEMELSIGWSAVEVALLARVEQSADHLAFTHGPTHRKAASRAKQLDDMVAQMDIPAMLVALVQAKRPRLIARASEWSIENENASAADVEIPVTHHLDNAQVGPASMLGAGVAASQLRALYSCTNGGELFVPVANEPREPGLQFIPDSEWDAEREHMMTWITMGFEDDDDLPEWVNSLVPFAVLPGDASRWVTPLEGPYAGTVMLSNDDVPEEHVRYKSIAHFIAALRLCPEEILGTGGYVGYLSADEKHQLYPVGYDEDE